MYKKAWRIEEFIKLIANNKFSSREECFTSDYDLTIDSSFKNKSKKKKKLNRIEKWRGFSQESLSFL